MTKGLRCPKCGVPLEVEEFNSASNKCEFCGSIISSSENYSFDLDMNDLLGQARKLKEIKQIAILGNKIEAIKIYRETFTTGLKEAKDAIDNMVAGKPIVFTNAQFSPTQNVLWQNGGLIDQSLKLAEIKGLIQSGNKIKAIKVYRETFNVGLKEAKDAVEGMTKDSFSPENKFGQINIQSTFGNTNSSGMSPTTIILTAILGILLILAIIFVVIKIIA